MNKYLVFFPLAFFSTAAALATDQLTNLVIARPPMQVEVTTIKLVTLSNPITLTGVIAAQHQSELSFRIGGRIVKRAVDVGDHVNAGDILIQLDETVTDANVAAAQAAIAASDALVSQALAAFNRQKKLIVQGYTTRSNLDVATEALQLAQTSYDTSLAQLKIAQDALTSTVLRADASGVITNRAADIGEVVQPAQAVLSLAEDGARDAIFDVNEAVLLVKPEQGSKISIALSDDPNIHTTGTVRQLSPTIDSSTGTVRVKIGLGHATE